MRLIVARCRVSYAGRLSTVLPEAVRLLMLGPDGTFMVWADGGGVKPLNWMTPPTVVEEQRDDEGELRSLLVRRLKGEDRLQIEIAEILSDQSSTSSTPSSGSRRRGSSANCRSCWRLHRSAAARACGWCGASGRPTSARSI